MDFQTEFNRHVQAAIAHTHDEDKKLILRDLLCGTDDPECGEPAPEASTLDSGGHAPTPPAPPIKKPQ